jgi:glycosyltransferase involved in cell wall biosynthesis
MESVPPHFYGGAERIVSYITEELVALGHDVTLFASADSKTSARLVPCCPKALRLDPDVSNPIPHYMLMLEKVRGMAAQFDILHFHFDLFHFPIFSPISQKTLTTLHGRQDSADMLALYAGFPSMPLVSISNAQRKPVLGASYEATIYHGLPVNLLEPVRGPQGNYLAFIGRISPEKGIESAIRISRMAGLPLKIAAKVDPVDAEYFKARVEPQLSDPGVDFVGEINEQKKAQFLGRARGLLFPIDWPEPFGLVMIEAMACGTPVLAFRNGAVPEVIDEGQTGYIVDNEQQALERMSALLALDRPAIRRRFEERFTASRMAADYVRVYESLISKSMDRRILRLFPSSLFPRRVAS